ncbi:olfactory receptor 51L1-like, partial [Clarias magur]
IMNSSTGSAYENFNLSLPQNVTPKESFSSVLTKNIVAVLVWLALSILNGTMTSTFFRHNFFYEDPRYIMFIYMVINDAVQLTLVTGLYV